MARSEQLRVSQFSPAVESLEARRVLTAWSPQGPAAITFGQVEHVGTDNQVAGALHTVVAHPTDSDILWAGATNGGIWRTDDATALSPTWRPQTDNLPSLSIGAMEFDPTDATNNTLVAALGRFSSFGADGDTLGGVLRTTDGGNNWTALPSVGLSPATTPPGLGESLSGIAARGSDIVVTSRFFFGGIHKSTDTGATFTSIAGPDFGASDDFFDLVADPTDPTGMRLYAAGEDKGIYRSGDFGSTWTKITSPAINPELDSMITDSRNNNTEMAVSPTTGRLFAGILLNGRLEGIFYSDDADTAASPTWVRMDTPVLPLPTPVSFTVTGATFATPIEITTSVAHGLATGDRVIVSGVTGNTAANGNFRVTPTSATTFTLDFSAGNAAWVSGGTVTPIVGASPSGEKPGAQGGIHFAILVDPTDDDIVYIGGDRQEGFPNAIGAENFSGSLFRGDASIARGPAAIPSPQWDHLTHDIVPAFDAPGGTASGSSPHADAREMVFDADGNIVEVDDGGIYRRTSPKTNTGDWFSVNGSLQVAEQHDIAYDPLHEFIISGNQDTGTTYQPAAAGTPGSDVWTTLHQGDGGDVAVAPKTGAPGSSVTFTSFQFLAGFRRTEWSAPGVTVGAPTFASTAFIPDVQFVTPFELNAVDPTRMAVGGLAMTYESMPGVDVTTSGLGAGSFGPVASSAGVNFSAMAFGHVSDPDLILIGSGSTLGIRPGPVGTPMVPSAVSIPGGDFITDIVVDPSPFGAFPDPMFPTLFASTVASSTPRHGSCFPGRWNGHLDRHYRQPAGVGRNRSEAIGVCRRSSGGWACGRHKSRRICFAFGYPGLLVGTRRRPTQRLGL